jgi:hypothetical protein
LGRQHEQSGEQAQPRGSEQLGCSDVDDFTFHCLLSFYPSALRLIGLFVYLRFLSGEVGWPAANCSPRLGCG